MINKHKPVIVHIHTDYKFVGGFTSYDNQSFTNKTIILENEIKYKGLYTDQAILMEANLSLIDKIIEICFDADIVILYGLCNLKSYIAISLPENIIIIWRFFGSELYGKMLDKVTTRATQKYLYKGLPKRLYFFLKYSKKMLKRIINEDEDYTLFNRAVNRINYMLLLCREEYEYLKLSFTNLPQFIQLPFRPISNASPDLSIKLKQDKPIIIVGNSRSYYNNHFDIISIINNNSKKSDYIFTLLLNYGNKTKYYEDLIKLTSKKSYYKIVEDFINPTEFLTFYNPISAVVLNVKRQMAVGNIFIAIRSGVKIYLNKDNVFYNFLINEGFFINTIQDFIADLESGNTTLTQEEIDYNLDAYKNITHKYNLASYNSQIMALLK